MPDHITITVIVHDPLIGDAVERIETFDRDELRRDPTPAVQWASRATSGAINTTLYGPQQ